MKIPCRYIGCSQLISTPGYCPRHAKQVHTDYRKSRTDTDEQRFYRSGAWRELSLQYRRDHPVCEVCGTKPSVLVHHIKHVRDGGARLAKSNLQAVCRSCQALAHHGNK